MDVWPLPYCCVVSPSFCFPCSDGTFVLKALSDRFLSFSGPFVLILSRWSQAIIPPEDASLTTLHVRSLNRLTLTASMLLCWVFHGFAACVIDLPPVWNLPFLVWPWCPSLEIIPVSVNRKLMLFVPTSISIKLNLTVPLYQWQATNFTCKVSSIVLRAASWVSLHGAFSVYVFHSTSYCLWERLIMLMASWSKRFLSRCKASCSLGVKQGLHNNIRIVTIFHPPPSFPFIISPTTTRQFSSEQRQPPPPPPPPPRGNHSGR